MGEGADWGGGEHMMGRWVGWARGFGEGGWVQE